MSNPTNRIAPAVVSLLLAGALLGACAGTATVTASGSAELPSAGATEAPGTAVPDTGAGSTSTTRRRDSTTSTTGPRSTTTTTRDDDDVIQVLADSGLLTPTDLDDGTWETTGSGPEIDESVFAGAPGSVVFDAEDCPDVVATQPLLADPEPYPHASTELRTDQVPGTDRWNRTIGLDAMVFPDEETAEQTLAAVFNEDFFTCFQALITEGAVGDSTARSTTGKAIGDGKAAATVELQVDGDGDGTFDFLAFHGFRVDRVVVTLLYGARGSEIAPTDQLALAAADKVRSALDAV